jgi:hypothetical protein
VKIFTSQYRENELLTTPEIDDGIMDDTIFNVHEWTKRSRTLTPSLPCKSLKRFASSKYLRGSKQLSEQDLGVGRSSQAEVGNILGTYLIEIRSLDSRIIPCRIICI